MSNKYNKYSHEDWVVALWAGFFIMWFGVSIIGLTIGVIHLIIDIIK